MNQEKSKKEESEISEALVNFRSAGEIVQQINENLEEIVEPNKTFLEVAEWIENFMREKDAEPAFPVNICVGNISAHDTPETGRRKLPDDEIIKIDFGASVDGFPSDNARSFYFGEEEEKKNLIETAEKALNKGLAAIKTGADLSQFGEIVESFVEERGFKVVENLTGHSIEQYTVHGDKSIPVTKGAERVEAKEGEIYGAEVFVSNGRGFARASEDVRIYSLMSDLPERIRLRLQDARNVLSYLRNNRKELPFTPRWFYEELGRDTVKIGISVLSRGGVLLEYPVLKEEDGASVAQAEKTIRVKEEGIEILT